MLLVTPLLVIFNERILQPKLQANQNQRAHDSVDEENEVIIAGFGRVGTVIMRFLLGQGIKATVLDHDPDQVVATKGADDQLVLPLREGFAAVEDDARDSG